MAKGRLDADDGKIDVNVYPEHIRIIKTAGYNVAWYVAGEIAGDDVPVRLVEHTGRRRIASVLKLGTEDEWIEVKQKR